MQIISQGKMVGSISGGNFHKTVSKSKHLFRKLNAWGIDREVFNSEIVPTCTTIEVYDKDEHKTYRSTVENFNLNGISLDVGSGRQIFLPLTKWEVK